MCPNCTMSKNSWPILCSKLLYRMGQDFLDTQYLCKQEFCWNEKKIVTNPVLYVQEVLSIIIGWVSDYQYIDVHLGWALTYMLYKNWNG